MADLENANSYSSYARSLKNEGEIIKIYKMINSLTGSMGRILERIEALEGRLEELDE